jgi:hypothetical protein
MPTTPAAPAVTAIGAVTELNPDEHITGMLTAREMEYAAASVGVACQFKLNFVILEQWRNSLIQHFLILFQVRHTFSISPSTPGFVGLEHFPPSV